MRIRKMSAFGMTGILLAALFVMPVSAHGHYHNRTDASVNAVCEVCTVEDCTKSGLHVHDDVTYCGYDHESGYCDGSCGAVAVCTMEGCVETGHHSHNKQTYCGYDHECGYCDGSCGAVEVCTVAGCTKTGLHSHNGQTYCGYDHESGYCDNSCGKAAVSHSCGHGRHHGR